MASVRRKTYQADLFQYDYFIVKHLKLFLHRSLLAHVTKGALVADIGCGEQPLRGEVESLGGTYLGIDLAQNLQKNVQLIGKITNIPLADRTFDVVFCTEVLEHVPDTYTAFQELARLVKPGGVVIITTPFAYPLHEEPYDYVRLTPYQISACAVYSGLGIKELNISGNEIEVLATIWSNMWFRMTPCGGNFIKRIWNRMMCVSSNLLALAGNSILEPLLPQKYYLSVLCILTKPVG